jgi:hypothetical protein
MSSHPGSNRSFVEPLTLAVAALLGLAAAISLVSAYHLFVDTPAQRRDAPLKKDQSIDIELLRSNSCPSGRCLIASRAHLRPSSRRTALTGLYPHAMTRTTDVARVHPHTS